MEGEGGSGETEAKTLPWRSEQRNEEMGRAEVRAEASCSTSMDYESDMTPKCRMV